MADSNLKVVPAARTHKLAISADDFGDLIERLEQAEAILDMMATRYGPGCEGHDSEVQRVAEATSRIVHQSVSVLLEASDRARQLALR